MRLPFISFGKKEQKNYYAALLFQDEFISSVVFEESLGRMHIVGKGEEHFSTSLDQCSFEELLETTDKAIGKAEENLPENIQTHKTIFGVREDWTMDGKIKKEYLTILKRLCDELDLTPLGFLVFTEAIIHLLQTEEGAPVSGVVVEIGKKFITLSLVRAGRVVTTKQVPFSTPIPQTVDDALKELDAEILPSRIILFDAEQKEKLMQGFIGHTWSKTLPFLHMPQVTVLPAGFEIKGILYGTAAQMNFQVNEEETKQFIKAHISSRNARPTPKITEDEKLSLEESKEKQAKVPDEDETMDNEEEPENKQKIKTAALNAEYFGFIKDKDVGEDKDTIAEIPEDVKNEETDFQKPTGTLATQAFLLQQGFIKTVRSFLDGLRTKKEKKQPMPSSTPTPIAKNSASHFNKKLVFGIALFLVCCIGLILLYIFGVSAKVTLGVTPKVLNDQQQVTFATDGQSDFSNNVIGAQPISVDETGNVSANATGTKETGTPATGTVTIFSTLTTSSTLPKGTTLTSDNGLTFTLNSDVTIASSSGDAGDFTTVSNVSVTSSDIGPNYNLPSGSKFSVGNLNKSDVSAKNDNAFSGGTKKDITVVAQKDVDSLVATLTKNLEGKAKDDMQKSLDASKQFLGIFTKEDLTKKTLSSNVGAQAKTVSLAGTVTYQSLSVNKDDLTSFAKQDLQNKVPSGNLYKEQNLETNLSNLSQGKDSISANLDMKELLLPNVDISQTAKTVAGKSLQEAISTLKSVPQVSSVTINFSPNIPFLPKLLPRLSQKITIQITTNE